MAHTTGSGSCLLAFHSATRQEEITGFFDKGLPSNPSTIAVLIQPMLIIQKKMVSIDSRFQEPRLALSHAGWWGTGGGVSAGS